jgi:hypothetical protein
MSTDKSAAAARELVERWMGKKHPITMRSYVSDLTALIEEHYYPKEFVEWLLKQDSYPQDNGGTYFLVNGVAGDDATLLFYHWNKYIKKENER